VHASLGVTPFKVLFRRDAQRLYDIMDDVIKRGDRVLAMLDKLQVLRAEERANKLIAIRKELAERLKDAVDY